MKKHFLLIYSLICLGIVTGKAQQVSFNNGITSVILVDSIHDNYNGFHYDNAWYCPSDTNVIFSFNLADSMTISCYGGWDTVVTTSPLSYNITTPTHCTGGLTITLYHNGFIVYSAPWVDLYEYSNIISMTTDSAFCNGYALISIHGLYGNYGNADTISAVTWDYGTGIGYHDTLNMAYFNGQSQKIIAYATMTDGCMLADSIITYRKNPMANLLCWTTVDTLSLHNLVSWDTTGTGNESIDSILLYFLNANNIWQKIGEESYNDSNQYFVDSTSNPNAVTVRYCVRTIDNCGDTSGYSNWQNTMFISNIGSGTFSWSGTGYLIEGNSLPVLTYYLFRNDSLIDSVSGTQNKITDVNYSPLAEYYVGAKLSIPICPLSAIAMGHKPDLGNSITNLSHSNILNKKPTGIESVSNLIPVNIYPDPNNGFFAITGLTKGQTIEVYNYAGQEISSDLVGNTIMHVDISVQANGIYLIRILNKDGSVVTSNKIVKIQ